MVNFIDSVEFILTAKINVFIKNKVSHRKQWFWIYFVKGIFINWLKQVLHNSYISNFKSKWFFSFKKRNFHIFWKNLVSKKLVFNAPVWSSLALLDTVNVTIDIMCGATTERHWSPVWLPVQSRNAAWCSYSIICRCPARFCCFSLFGHFFRHGGWQLRISFRPEEFPQRGGNLQPGAFICLLSFPPLPLLVFCPPTPTSKLPK